MVVLLVRLMSKMVVCERAKVLFSLAAGAVRMCASMSMCYVHVYVNQVVYA